MEDDWSAVGRAISNRLDERGMTMTELAKQAEVSLTTVRELVHVLNTRRRHPRTLGKLSKVLGWPEGHLQQVLRTGEVESDPVSEEPGELAAIRRELQELRRRVDALESKSS
ncbi:helix-turn-helix domain-containing protein [Saccharopolyspora shandongensis]|uniref:helix-turn-helix domain-containing protein n=1 Tax=Saccharopolyspora shandongensis TaxID=418495 RepID=UPI0033CAE3D1